MRAIPHNAWWLELFELWNSEGFKCYLSKRAKGCTVATKGTEKLTHSDDAPESEVVVPWIGTLTVWD